MAHKSRWNETKVGKSISFPWSTRSVTLGVPSHEWHEKRTVFAKKKHVDFFVSPPLLPQPRSRAVFPFPNPACFGLSLAKKNTIKEELSEGYKQKREKKIDSDSALHHFLVQMSFKFKLYSEFNFSFLFPVLVQMSWVFFFFAPNKLFFWNIWENFLDFFWESVENALETPDSMFFWWCVFAKSPLYGPPIRDLAEGGESIFDPMKS